MSASDKTTVSAPRPSAAAFAWLWFRIGCLSFGGPAGQIAMMQSELVDRLGWIGQRRFLHVLNFCMLLPGPEAQQVATYLGWRSYGIVGGLVSGGLFILPGALFLFGMSWLKVTHGEAPLVAALFAGIKPMVVAIILAAVWRIGRRALKTSAAVALAGAAFLALFVLGAPFPLVVFSAAVIGAVAARTGHHCFADVSHGDEDEGEPLSDGPAPSIARALWLILTFLVLWAVPTLLVIGLLGHDPWGGIVALFTKAAFVTFGGAYAVLPYVAQQAVDTYGWLSPADMIDGLALAETTPGPLILVLQYVGHVAGWNAAGAVSGLAGSALGAWLTLHVTFLPCFLFIFVGAPYVERLIHHRAASGALAAVTAAVVGVVLNLGVYLGSAVLAPGGVLDPRAAVLAAAALFALTRWNWAVHRVVLAGAGFGVAGWTVATGHLIIALPP